MSITDKGDEELLALLPESVAARVMRSNREDALLLVGDDGRIVTASAKAGEVFGYGHEELRGSATELLIPERFLRTHEHHRDTFVARGVSRSMLDGIDLVARHRSGREFPVAIALEPIHKSTGNMVLCTVRSFAQRWQAGSVMDRQMTICWLLGRIASIANEAGSSAEVLQASIEAVCEITGWPVGHAYRLAAEDDDTLEPSTIWYVEDQEQFETFKRITMATTFTAGIGLPGRVLDTGQPAWITDVTVDSNFPRAKLAQNLGVKAGFGFPVLVGSRVVAVLEFFSPRIEAPDEALLRTMKLIGVQLGRAVEREWAQRRVAASDERLRDAIESIYEGFILYDADDRLVICNSTYRDFYPAFADLLKPGAKLEDVARAAFESGAVQNLAENVEAWVKKRVEQQRVAEGTHEQHLADGRWLLCRERKTRSGGTVGIRTDITERKQAEENLRKSEVRFKHFAAAASDWFWEMGRDLRFTYFSESYYKTTGFRPEDKIGTTRTRYVDKNELVTDSEKWTAHIADQEARRPFKNFEYAFTDRNGNIRHVRTSGIPVFSADGDFTGYQGTGSEITDQKLAQEALSHQVTHDPLTGLSNRREFERRLGRVLETARVSQDEHALCYLDLDQFKVVNDTCGHMVGDELLRQLGQLLLASVRKRDTLARLGGDEFGVLMEHCTLDQARRVANKVRKAVADFRFVWEQQVFRIGVSIGLVPITATSESVANLLSAADSACYVAKDEGRNRVHVYHLGDTELARRQGEMQWVARIDQALEDQRLQLWSQPIVPVKKNSGEGKHFELLLRLVDEQGDIVPPGAFLPAAERYGISTKLDRWVVAAAFDWLGHNPKLLEQLYLCCINLSGTSLADEEFLAFVQERLKQSRIPARKICFEVTETAAIANLSRAITFMETLKEQGCRFALDDFGSGLSSFAYLKTLPVDYLKIDGAFVKDIVDDEVDLALVRSINDVGKVMGMQTIAEFVENKAILKKLREIGVDYAQGYGIGYPAPI